MFVSRSDESQGAVVRPNNFGPRQDGSWERDRASASRFIRSGAVSGRSSTSTTRRAKERSADPASSVTATTGADTGPVAAVGSSTKSRAATPSAFASSGSQPAGQSVEALSQFEIVLG